MVHHQNMGLISVLAGRFPGGTAPTKLFRIDPKQLDFPHALIPKESPAATTIN